MMNGWRCFNKKSSFKEFLDINFEGHGQSMEGGDGWNMFSTFESLIPSNAEAQIRHVFLSETFLLSIGLNIHGNFFYQRPRFCIDVLIALHEIQKVLRRP